MKKVMSGAIGYITNPSANNKINLIRYQRSKLTEDASQIWTFCSSDAKTQRNVFDCSEATLKDNSTGGNSISLINKIKKERISTELTDNASEEKIQTEITHEYICVLKEKVNYSIITNEII